MITLNTFKEMLPVLGFREEKKGVFSKPAAADWTVSVKVDFNNCKFIYPEQIDTGDNTTCNFEHPENFVVFECVCALLDKGYRPEHIALEKCWKLGHEAKGGRADICVSDQDGKTLLIVECKTYGQEYAKERKQMLQDGGQLFSYWQQEGSTQWLALYASDFKDGQVIHECEVIRSVDDKNVTELAKKDDSYRLYANAHTVAELFEAWDETYGKAFLPDVIFGKDSKAYEIGIRPLRSGDLKDFRAEDKIVNRFEEILRHNNVSDKENAFNRLTALFICKLVDEINHANDDDELEFQYKQGTDTYETLQDRLQKLHQEGMKNFMRENIFYIANDYPEKLMAQYARQKRQAMIDDLRKTIRILKFYSNNDFSFKDVHNEELFLQNGKVLVEVVQLFERYRIVYHSKEQFLGDLFEQLLNKGFKQNEGQFFTPMPVTRFIWDSLPLENVIHNSGKYNLPKVIDFACGAGHFLTEAVEAINAYLDHTNQQELKKENAWVEKSIFGIEKDYRLARVSKISLFMNGAGYGNIIFGDGLDNYPDKEITAGSFDILVANPPYSVSAFKQHFKPKNNSFELTDRITNTGSEIEVLFVERISQLLNPKGLAAVILPASILSNSSASYIGAREILLENFKIRAIVQFGSKTFGATGTNTIVAFLEKYDEPPKRKELVKDSANAIQSNAEITDWEDQKILDAYLVKIEVSAEDYRKFCAKDQSMDVWCSHAYFGQYVKSFEALSEIRKKKTQKSFCQLPKEEQNRILQADFYRYASVRETDKLRFFALVYNQTTLVVTAPSDNDEQKDFLGYDWSNRKGAEGIQILNPGGKLYCDSDRYADDNVSAIIRSAFTSQMSVPADLEKYCAWRDLQDMIDFSRAEFNKEIKPSATKKVVIKSKWNLVDLDSVIQIIRGVTYDKTLQVVNPTETIILPADNITLNGELDICKPIYLSTGNGIPQEKRLRKNDCFMCFSSGSKSHVGKITYIDCDLPYFAGGFMGILRAKNDQINTHYLAYILNSMKYKKIIRDLSSGANINNLSRKIGSIKLPLPPLDIQQKIVDECASVEIKQKTVSETLRKAKQTLTDAFMDSLSSKGSSIKLLDETLFDVSIGRRVLDKDVQKTGEIAVYSANVNEPFGYIDKLLIKDFSLPSVLWGIDGDWMVNLIPANQKFYPTDHCGVIRIKSKDIIPEYFMMALEEVGKQARFSRTLRASTDRIRALTIPLPSIEVQKQIAKLYQTVIQAQQQVDELESKIETEKQAILNKWL